MTQEKLKQYAKLHLLSRITSVMFAMEHAELQSVKGEFKKMHYRLECELKEIEKL